MTGTRSAVATLPPSRQRATPTTRLDAAAAERSVAELLRALGEDPESPRLRNTPGRVAAMLAEAVQRPAPPVVSSVQRTDSRELITIAGIPFQALCEHHLLPFRGSVDIGYLPDGHIVGVSLPVRVVDYLAHGLQLQERLTDEIADWLFAHLDARGVGVVVRAEHLCMSFRGVGDRTTSLRTSAFRGELTALDG